MPELVIPLTLTVFAAPTFLSLNVALASASVNRSPLTRSSERATDANVVPSYTFATPAAVTVSFRADMLPVVAVFRFAEYLAASSPDISLPAEVNSWPDVQFLTVKLPLEYSHRG